MVLGFDLEGVRGWTDVAPSILDNQKVAFGRFGMGKAMGNN